jgi:hypothetical protein
VNLSSTGDCQCESKLLRSEFLRAYNAAEEIIDARLVSPETAPEIIEEMFAAEKTAFIHAPFPTYGCYALWINRPETGECPHHICAVE